MGLAGVEWAMRGVKGHQRCVLEVLGEQRVSLSIWVCHIGGDREMLLGAIGRRDACLLPRPEKAASANRVNVSSKPWQTDFTQIGRGGGIFLFFPCMLLCLSGYIKATEICSSTYGEFLHDLWACASPSYTQPLLKHYLETSERNRNHALYRQ